MNKNTAKPKNIKNHQKQKKEAPARQIDNGKGLDNKIQDLQQSNERQFGNGKGIDDKIDKVQKENFEIQKQVISKENE